MKIFCCFAFLASVLNASDFRLHWAISSGDAAHAKFLIEGSETVESLSTLDSPGRAPMHLAVEYDNIGILESLLDHNADPSVESRMGETPIIMAFRRANYPMVSLLQKKNVRLESESFYKFLLGKKIAITWPSTKALIASQEEFSKIIGLCDKHQRGHNIIIYTSSFLYTDLEFFDTLLQISRENTEYHPIIRNLLRELALEQFPLGHPPKEALAKLNELLNFINADDHLRFRLWKAVKEVSEQPLLVAFHRPLKIFELASPNLRPQLIANAITHASESLMRSLSIRDIMQWLLGEKKGKSVQRMGRFSERLQRWFAYQVEREPNLKNRQQLAIKLVKIANEFYRQRNYWGMSQILSVFNNPAISRLNLLKNSKKHEQELAKISEIIDTSKNNKAYRTSLEESLSKYRVFPIIDIIFKDLRVLFDQRPNKADINWLVSMSIIFKQIHNYKKIFRVNNHKDRQLAAFFYNLPLIDETIIDAYSHSYLPWSAFKDEVLRTPHKADLKDYNFRQLLGILLRAELDSCVPALLDSGLHNGAKIVKALYENPKFNHYDRKNFLLDNNFPEESARLLEQTLYMNKHNAPPPPSLIMPHFPE